jgi:hypothetical protein
MPLHSQACEQKIIMDKDRCQVKFYVIIKKEAAMTLNVNIESSARRLFPNLTPERAIVELLLERAQKNLIKYKTMARQLKTKYGLEFAEFRKNILSGQPDTAAEQDYFDWELAVTGIADMQAEIKRLKALKKA